MVSCSKKEDAADDVLLRYGDKQITYNEVIDLMPDDVMPEDSVRLFKAILDGWIRDQVLADFAEERLYDTKTIDRLVNDYRNSLIVLEYLNRMAESQIAKIDEQRVKEYFESHKNDLKLEVPLVKGVFIKVNSGTPHKEEIIKLITDENPEKIDELESNWIDKALEYNYFRDKWIDWETIKGMIPYRFGDPDLFLKENSFFSTEYDDCTYYLQISEWMPSGELQPFEYARTWIASLLSQGQIADYERVLVNSLVDKSLKSKKLESIGYDPIKQELK